MTRNNLSKNIIIKRVTLITKKINYPSLKKSLASLSLKDKVIFMSGGSRGIGLAMAKRAAQDGAKVVVAAKTADPHPKLAGTIYTAADEIIEAGGDALPVLCDIRNEDNVRDAINKTVEHFGGIDICINNASAIQLTNVVDTEMKRYDLMHQINGRGTYMAVSYTHLTLPTIYSV